MPPAVKLAAANARDQRSILTLSPRKLIRNLPLTHPLGLTLSLPLNRPSGFPIYVAASQRAPFPSMSSTPVNSIVEDLEAALSQLKLARCPHSLAASLAALPSMSLIPIAPFAAIAADLKNNKH